MQTFEQYQALQAQARQERQVFRIPATAAIPVPIVEEFEVIDAVAVNAAE